jgi:hypothetical protein
MTKSPLSSRERASAPIQTIEIYRKDLSAPLWQADSEGVRALLTALATDPTAVHVDRLPGDEGGVIACQERHSAHEVGRYFRPLDCLHGGGRTGMLGHRWSAWTMLVMDKDGKNVITLPFSEVPEGTTRH